MGKKPSIPDGGPDRIIFDAGVEEGRLQMKTEVLTMLEKKYMAPEIIRGSEEGNAILTLATSIAKELKVKS